MKSAFEYRSYDVASEDGRYTAKSQDGEPCILKSRYLLRVLRGIDTIWEVLDGWRPHQPLNAPSWIQALLTDPLGDVDLDKAAEAIAESLADECRKDHRDPISVLKFPKMPIRAIGGAAAATIAALSIYIAELTSVLSPIMELTLA